MRKTILIILILALVQTFVFAEEGVRYEAEDGFFYQANMRRGEAGDLHVAQMDDPGAYVEFELSESKQAGIYQVRVYYAAVIEGDNSHTLFVNDEQVDKVVYPRSQDGWGAFSEDTYVEVEVTLEEGINYLRLEKTGEDDGFAELDAIRVIPVTLYSPDPNKATPTPEETPVVEATDVVVDETEVPTTSVVIEDTGSSISFLVVFVISVLLLVGVIVLIILSRRRR